MERIFIPAKVAQCQPFTGFFQLVMIEAHCDAAHHANDHCTQESLHVEEILERVDRHCSRRKCPKVCSPLVCTSTRNLQCQWNKSPLPVACRLQKSQATSRCCATQTPSAEVMGLKFEPHIRGASGLLHRGTRVRVHRAPDSPAKGATLSDVLH